MTEAALLLVVVATGWLLVDGDDDWRIAAALPVGLAAMVAVELLLLSTGTSVARPRVALGLALVAAGLVARRRGADVRPADWRRVAGAVVAIVVTTVITWWLPVVTVTADSFRYLTVAQQLADIGDTSEMSAFLLQTRGLATGAVHGLAAAELGYLRAVGPLVGLSAAGMLVVLVREGVAGLDPLLRRWLAIGAATLLLTNHRVIFNAFYINGHMLFAAWLLVVVATMWRWRRSGTAEAGLLAAALCAAGLVVLRPEGALVALLALAPAALDGSLAVRSRRWMLGALGGTTVLWHAVVLIYLYRDAVNAVEPSVVGMAGLGAVVVVVAIALPVIDGNTGRHPLIVLHGLAWAGVAVLTARDPDVLIDSAAATLRNVLWDGRWGASLLMLSMLLCVALVRQRIPAEDALLFPLFTFVPLSILLAFLRDGAYRMGPGDSLNRMILHIVPIAVLALALTAAGTRRRWRTTDAGGDLGTTAP